MDDIREEEDASKLQLGAEFEQATPLLISEVAILLEHKSKQSGDSSIFSAVFDDTLAYAREFRKGLKDKAHIQEIREILNSYELRPYEIAAIANLCPESVEEALALVPTLESRSEAEIEEMLNKIVKFKRP